MVKAMISVFTPTHHGQWLNDCYESLKEQTFQDWEWVIVPNNGAIIPDFGDDRVKIFRMDVDVDRVGALKYYACLKAMGDILVELDHDDLLMPTCLERVAQAFKDDPDATMVFSNDTHCTLNFAPAQTWSKYYGWEYRDVDYKGHHLLENVSPDATPQNISRIWFAPDHVRAWRTDAYWRLGSHNPRMNISDDHDLVARNYINGKIKHIDECLYVYRVHPGNTTFARNQEIQDTMWNNYNKYIWPMVGKWADDRGLLKVDLGGGLRSEPGYVTVDANNPASIQADLDLRWPFQDNSVGVFRATDIIEHLKDPIHTMNEAWRCLAHGGFFMIDVPSTDGRGAFQDPTHASFWNSNSFLYYTQAAMYKFIAHRAKCKYQAMRIIDFFPNERCKEINIPYTQAHLIALKTDGRFYGAYDW